MRNKFRILYFGTPHLSAELLEFMIVNGFNIVGVVAQSDKPVGRKKEILPVPTKVVANKFNIPVYQFEKLKDNLDFFKSLDFDVILTFSYGKILPEELLKLAKIKSLNIHPSILPKYRGPSPIQFSLLNGDLETGIALMDMVKEMDAGDIYKIVKFSIDQDDNFDLLCLKVSENAKFLILNYLEKVLNNEIVPIKQDENKVSFTRKILDEDCTLDFYNNDAFSIHNKIRAFSSVPGAYFVYKGIKYKIYKTKIINQNYEPNKVIEFNKKRFVISCKRGSIEILILQKEGKKVLNYVDFYNGNKNDFIINEFIY